jgi:hypothetical protein
MDSSSLSLSSLVGKDIYAKIPLFKGNEMVTLKLLAVENGGIWVESKDFMEEMLLGTPHKMTAKTFALFLPFAQILAIYTLTNAPWISQRALE